MATGTRPEIDPYANDPGFWGCSLAALQEIVFPVLEAAGVRSVIEVGAYAGDLTELLADWATPLGGRVAAIDPAPQERLARLAREREDIELVQATSHEALKTMATPDAAVIDGDHNYYTVAGELRILAERANETGAPLPLFLLHDVCWPHGRRDAYYTPEQIPDEHRQPMLEGAGLFPGEPAPHPGGLPYQWVAAEEGGPRNGVLTAAEDFVAERERLRLAVVPSFFGLGVIWHLDAPYADALAEILDPWDRDPLLERLEANRVRHLAAAHVHRTDVGWLQVRDEQKNALLRELAESRAFAVAEQLSKLHGRGTPAFTQAEVRRLLGT
jgi:Methyltransferase domain